MRSGLPMLPSFPKVQRLRARQNVETIRRYTAEASAIIQLISRHIQFEGRNAVIERHDDSRDEVNMVGVQAEMVIKFRPIEEFDDAALDVLLHDVAGQMAKGQSEHMYATLSDGVEKVGNVVDAKGGALTEDHVFDMFERLQFSFDDRGEWTPPTMLGGTGSEGHAQIIQAVMSSKKFATLLEKKRDEHRRREAGRILVG